MSQVSLRCGLALLMVLLGGLGLLSLSQLFCRVRLELSLDLEVLLGFPGGLVGMALLVLLAS